MQRDWVSESNTALQIGGVKFLAYWLSTLTLDERIACLAVVHAWISETLPTIRALHDALVEAGLVQGDGSSP